MITLNLQAIMKARNIASPRSWLHKKGMTSSAAKNMLYTEPSSIYFTHIEFLCKHLICQPNDLFTYHPSKKDPLPDDHPLQKLVRNKAMEDLEKTMGSLSYQEILEVSKFIMNKKTEIKNSTGEENL